MSISLTFRKREDQPPLKIERGIKSSYCYMRTQTQTFIQNYFKIKNGT